jgi:acyl-CoA synthetase (NDP forming)
MHTLDSLLKPQSIAVVGASRRAGSIGRQILHQLIEFEYRGMLFPVNPKADFVHSMKAYPSVSSIPDQVDLAIIVVPREAVLAVVDDCGRKGVKGLVVITAGFSETGEEGRRMEAELGERIRRYGMRMIGPNCMGLINTDPAVHMDSTFAPTLPLTGRVAFMSQSGALGVAILNIAQQLDIGFSYFVGLGNITDVSSNELLLYWENDSNTDLILMYLESIGNIKRFMQISRRISKRKPILAVKSGRTEAGAREPAGDSDQRRRARHHGHRHGGKSRSQTWRAFPQDAPGASPPATARGRRSEPYRYDSQIRSQPV